MADIIDSNDPQFNPNEWEECRESAFLWWWRMLATVSTIVLATLFYYYVEQTKKQTRKTDRKRKDSQEQDGIIERKTLITKYEQVPNGTTDSPDSGLRKRREEGEKEKTAKETVVANTECNAQLNNPDTGSSESWAINKVLTTVEVTLTRQKNGESEHHSEWTDDKAIVSGHSSGTNATSPDIDSLSTDRGDSWSVDSILQLSRHDKSNGLDEHDNRWPSRTPEKPSFVTELKVTDQTNGAADNESEEETTNSILEIAKVQTTEELLLKVETLEAITEIMRQAGLESSNLIFGIDYTASNKYQGEESFGGKSLHSIEKGLLNPYQQVISILGKTLAPFASSGFIAAYGFGDVKTSDSDVFSIKSEGVCHSFAEVLNVYNDITPQVILSGPTNFAPLIYEAMKICKAVRDYHILVIVADGQVTNEKATRRAIVDACKYPLSIIVVGVGDGPWEMMKVFDESLPKRKWDNFHFVEFHKVTTKSDNPDLAFAIQALLEIPDQFKKIKSLGLLEFSEE